MKTTASLLLPLLLLTVLNSQTPICFAQGTAFTYQGRLTDGANAANGSYDFVFVLYNAGFAGTQRGPILTNSAVPVSNGIFTASLDFGTGVFTGGNLWLEISVRTNGASGLLTLSPRQAILPGPYAIMANAASNLLGSLPAAQLSGTLPSTLLSGTYSGAVTLNNPANSFAGNGSGLANVNAATLGGLTPAGFWHTGGNTGANPTNGSFLGSSDNLPLELRVNGTRALRIEPNANGIPNIIGGGFDNTIETSAHHSVIAGGEVNRISFGSDRSTIAGGNGNLIQTNSTGSVIGGGIGNSIGTNSDSATIAGGTNNAIGDIATTAFIGGGAGNSIANSGYYSFIGGGQQNVINGYDALIGGGLNNVAIAPSVVVAGGDGNTASAYLATVGGGQNNTASGTAATVAGGDGNTASGSFSMVPGGDANTAGGRFSFAAGGDANATKDYSFVWSDGSATTTSSVTNSVTFRASGGYRLFTGSTPVGVQLPAGTTSWTTISDRNAKKNFAPVNGEAVLQKLASIPVQSWNYK